MTHSRKRAPAQILIVDDEYALWQMFNRTLARGGYHCHWAARAEEARTQLAARRFDLVLCDIVMPGESGLDLCRHIRTTWPDLPVIIVTGLSNMETANQALAMDIYGYMVKPVDRVQILINVANALKRRELEAQRQAYDLQLEKKVRERTRELEELNQALNVLLRKREQDRQALEQRMMENVHKTIRPYLEKLKASPLPERQRRYVEGMASGIDQIISPFANTLSAVSLNLTPGEFQVADLIRQGKSTKEIAALLHLSENTIMTHRYKIRTKLGLKNDKQNLRTYLNVLSRESR